MKTACVSARVRAAAAVVTVAIAGGCADLGVPDWSPDGRRIVYTRLAGARPEVRLLDVDAAETPRLVVSDAVRARWSTDGRRIFYMSVGEDGAKGLGSCLPDGTDPRTHVPRDQASVAWYAPAPGGDSVYYLSETDGAVYELDLEAARARRLLPEDVRCSAATLGPSGDLLACAVALAGGAAEGKEIREVRIFDIGRGEWLKQKTTLEVDAQAGATVTPTVLFTPDGREVVAFLDPTKEIVVLPLPRGRVRKVKAARGGLALVFATVSGDGKELHLTHATSMDGRGFLSQKVDLATGRPEVLVEDSPVLVGGPSWAPGRGAVAEHTAMGLRVSTPGDRWQKSYPVSADEHVRLGEDAIARGDGEAALALAKRALEGREAGTDVQRLRLLESDARAAMGERSRAARVLLEAWLLFPVSDVPPADVLRRATALRGADRLTDVIWRALRADAPARVKLLSAALALAAEPGVIAGLNFRIAEARLEAGDAQEAGKRFRLASEAADFPAADYAAGLAGLAHFASGRGERNDRFAAELLLKAIDFFPTSPLQDDYREALRLMRDPSTAALRRTPDAGHPTGLAAWGQIRALRSVSWSLRPTLGEGRRLLLKMSHDSSVFVARPEERARAVLTGIRGDVGSFAFAPSGALLAFAAGGPGGRGAYVIDLAGKVVAGDAAALRTGEFAQGEAVTSLAWAEDGKALVVDVALPDGTTEKRRIDVPLPRKAPAPARAPIPAPAH